MDVILVAPNDLNAPLYPQTATLGLPYHICLITLYGLMKPLSNRKTKALPRTPVSRCSPEMQPLA